MARYGDDTNRERWRDDDRERSGWRSGQGTSEREDERGFFARAFCEKEFGAQGLATRFVQVNNSLSAQKGTLRGMHYQLAPKAETKLVRCIRGAMYDVVLDLRDGSPTFGRSFGAELSAENRRMMWIPPGFAHGFLVTSDQADFAYKVTANYAPSDERSVAWNDPDLAIAWPLEREPTLSKRDAAAPSLATAELPSYAP